MLTFHNPPAIAPSPLAFSSSHRAFLACRSRETPLSDTEPIIFRPRRAGGLAGPKRPKRAEPARADRFQPSGIVSHPRRLWTQSRLRRMARLRYRFQPRQGGVFSFPAGQRSAALSHRERPKLARKQGAYSVVAAGGLILKRGHDLVRVLDCVRQAAGNLISHHRLNNKKGPGNRGLFVDPKSEIRLTRCS